MGRIDITSELWIDDSEFELKFTRGSGPGGQKVNKTESAVQLFFDIAASSLPEDVAGRLREIASGQVNSRGILVLESSNSRSQSRNRKRVVSRLVKLLRKAARKPKSRKKTRPSRASRERRIRNKKKLSEKKRLRRDPMKEDI